VLCHRKRQSLRVKGQVAEASYFVPFVPRGCEDMPTHVMDTFVAELRLRGLEVVGKPIVETQRELFSNGDNVRIASFVRKR
jgi:hypothetical protein